MKKSNLKKSFPIIGGVQQGHGHINPNNHASKGIVTDLSLGINTPKILSHKLNAGRQAKQALTGGK